MLLSIFTNCGNKDGETTTSTTDSTKNYRKQNGPNKLSDKDYQEYYESGALKVEGDLDDADARNGLWLSYYENGSSGASRCMCMAKKWTLGDVFPNGKVVI